METVFHPAVGRGFKNHGWLQTYHSFSFAGYYNSDKMHFGTLRVLNDDTVAGDKGFGWHPHDNMEIISIPLEGRLEHGDGMENAGVIQKGDVQVMSAGTGIVHQELNASKEEPVKFLQIWVFPRQLDLKPRYDQKSIAENAVKNDFQLIVSPEYGGADLWINQDAWFSLADFDKGFTKEYTVRKPENGVYVFVIEGEVSIGHQKLKKRDALGIWNTNSFELEANEDAYVLLMDIPLELPDYVR